MQPVHDALELFRQQRAVRAFTDRPVDEETLRTVLQAAIHAPSGSNTQPWHFIVVRDVSVKQQLSDAYEEAFRDAYGGGAPAGAAGRQPMSAAPVLIVACVDTPPSGRPGFQTGASIYPACQNLMLAARALGLGSVLTTLHRQRRERVHEILGIPDGIDSAAIIPLGWPDRDYGPNRRRPLEEALMYDRWEERAPAPA